MNREDFVRLWAPQWDHNTHFHADLDTLLAASERNALERAHLEAAIVANEHLCASADCHADEVSERIRALFPGKGEG